MVGQASKHLTVADLKTDHARPLLKEAIDEINHVQEELPEKERVNKEFLDALTLTTRKLNSVEEDGNTLEKKGIKQVNDCLAEDQQREEEEWRGTK